MRRVTPKVLALAGVVAAVTGAVVAMAFAVAQTSCQNGAGLVPNPALANHCGAEAWGARLGFLVLALGGLLVLAAGIRATPRYGGNGRSQAAASDQPEGPDGPDRPAEAPRPPGRGMPLDGDPGATTVVAPGEQPEAR